MHTRYFPVNAVNARGVCALHHIVVFTLSRHGGLPRCTSEKTFYVTTRKKIPREGKNDILFSFSAWLCYEQSKPNRATLPPYCVSALSGFCAEARWTDRHTLLKKMIPLKMRLSNIESHTRSHQERERAKNHGFCTGVMDIQTDQQKVSSNSRRNLLFNFIQYKC